MSTPVSFTVRPPTSSSSRRTGTWSAPSQRAFHVDSDDDDDDHFVARNRERERERRVDERIDGFGANGKALGGTKATPLVIAPQPNRDWRDAARKAPSYRPEGRGDEPVITHERTGDEPQRAGLRNMKAERERAANGSEDVKPNLDDLRPPPGAASTSAAAKAEPLSLEEQALQAVLAGTQDEETLSAAQRDLIIANDEATALARDLPDLPQESTLDDYDAVPVEAFGAAILRGMGYDPSKEAKVHVPKPRPALLGIGATSITAELPPSRKKDPKKRREAHATRGGRGFNAANLLVRRGDDSRASTPATGAATPDASSRPDSRRTSPGTGERRRRRDEDDYDSGREAKRRDERDRDRDYGRDRDRDRDRDRTRDRRREYETEEERARRKARERDERPSNGDRQRDRDRDDRDRDRYRDRDGRDGRDRRDDRDRDRDRRHDRDDRDRRDRDRDRERERR